MTIKQVREYKRRLRKDIFLRKNINTLEYILSNLIESYRFGLIRLDTFHLIGYMCGILNSIKVLKKDKDKEIKLSKKLVSIATKSIKHRKKRK
jgi:hypothetical protein